MFVGDVPEGHRREAAGHDQAAVQRVHDLAALDRPHEERADDRGQDGNAAQHQRVEDGVVEALEHQTAEQHGGDDGHGIGLEQVRSHAGAVTDVVTDVVGNHRRIARVVLGNTGFDLADQVGADVRALGEDTAAETREDRDQRAAESQADQRLHWIGAGQVVQDRGIVTGHTGQPQAHDQHAGDGTAAKRDLQRRVQALLRRFGSTHVGAHRNVHADVAGQAGKQCTDREAIGGQGVKREVYHYKQNDADHANGGVLAIEIGRSAFLNGGRDFLHARVTGGLGQNPAIGKNAVQDGQTGTQKYELQTFRHRSSSQCDEPGRLVCRPSRRKKNLIYV